MIAETIIIQIDAYLLELGTQSLFDGDKIRDMLFDLRLLCMNFATPLEVPVVPVS